MFAQLATFTGYAVWIGIAVFILLVSVPLRAGSQTGAMVLAVILLAGALAFTDFASRVSLFWLVVLAPVYVAAGIGYAIYRWRAFILDRKATARAAYLKAPATDITFDTWAPKNGYARPLAADNKERLTGWLALWPWSLAWELLSLPRRLFAALYERLTTVFERMSQKLWAE